jgi:DNA-binding NtrC family response regulator
MEMILEQSRVDRSEMIVENLGGKPGVLIIDPDAETRHLTTMELSRLGWQVWAFPEPDEAEPILREHVESIGIALIDLQLPGLQGARALNRLRLANPTLIRCAMSADLMPHMASAFRRISKTPLFLKPLDYPTLARELKQLLQS